MLEYGMTEAEGAATVVAVLLHGRGADVDDMLGLARALPTTWRIVAPRAPFPAAPWGYGPGYAWYRYLGGNRPESESFTRSLAELAALLTALPAALGVAPSRIVLGGFSQGGTLSLGYALSRTDSPPVLNFSGFVADHPEVDVARARELGARVFWGHGTRDGNIPFEMAVTGREALRAGGAALEARDYGIGHWIDGEELRDAVAWAERTLAAPTR